MMTWGHNGVSARFLTTRNQRALLSPCLVLVNDSTACCQVRVVMPLSVYLWKSKEWTPYEVERLVWEILAASKVVAAE